MRTVYLVSYDVADSKRLRKTYQILQGYGDPLQYSVFYCELSAMERQRLKDDLWEVLNFDEDRVMLVDLGPVGGRGDGCIEFWGDPRTMPDQRSPHEI